MFSSQCWCEPVQPACYQNLWLPYVGFHCGFQGFQRFPLATASFPDQIFKTLTLANRRLTYFIKNFV